jgi:hypothetical protein
MVSIFNETSIDINRIGLQHVSNLHQDQHQLDHVKSTISLFFLFSQ